jgi:hypothetical protein
VNPSSATESPSWTSSATASWSVVNSAMPGRYRPLAGRRIAALHAGSE